MMSMYRVILNPACHHGPDHFLSTSAVFPYLCCTSAPPTAAKTTTFLLQHHKHSPHTCRWVNSENLSMSVSYTRFSSSSAALKDKSQVQTALLTTVAYSCAVEGTENLSSIWWKRWKRQRAAEVRSLQHPLLVATGNIGYRLWKHYKNRNIY